uniref:Uncharacterized protein n=1 Tax=Leersia perrieri TaxID=77586 RepID=A0A0D9W211_9ORYZ
MALAAAASKMRRRRRRRQGRMQRWRRGQGPPEQMSPYIVSLLPASHDGAGAAAKCGGGDDPRRSVGINERRKPMKSYFNSRLE